MGKLKRILNKLLFPGAAVVLICVPAAAALLIYAFMYAGEDSPVAYIAYVFSAYALVILCANAFPIFRRGRQRAEQIPLVSRYMSDVSFRVGVSLHASLAVNVLYSALNAAFGVIYMSVWFGTLAVYYIFLAVLRFLLVRYVHRHGFGTNMRGEWLRYRACGAILVAMTAALAGVTVLVLHDSGGFTYAGHLIFIMAMYAFYTTIMGIVNLVRYRRYKSPAMSASRAVSLASALVSMLSLEVAMLTEFGAESEAGFRTGMILGSGVAVCLTVTGLGCYMIVRSVKELRAAGSLDLNA